MSILSTDFIIFTLITIIAYFTLPKICQPFILLCASIYFYVKSGAIYLIYLFIISAITFFMAKIIFKLHENAKSDISNAKTVDEKKNIKRKTKNLKFKLSGFAITIVIGIWIIIKYGNFLIDNLNVLLNVFSPTAKLGTLSLVLPMGMSFYTFSAVSYLVDVYRSKYKPENNFFRYMLFICFFPHIIQGPFSRFDHLGKTLYEKHSFSYDRLSEGMARILWGYFKKIAIADLISISTNEFLTNYNNYDGLQLICCIFLYGIQIYADFSGYMDIMCGICRILGIELAENFAQPYFAKSVADYWRRWHITLGAWFRDYLFYPLSMSKTAQRSGSKMRKSFGVKIGKLIPSYFALFFVWSATGLWHGASWKFLIWGYLNLIVIITSMYLEKTYDILKKKLRINDSALYWRIFMAIRTFMLVCFFRFFSEAKSTTDAFYFVGKILKGVNFSLLKTPGIFFSNTDHLHILIIVIGSLAIFAVDLLREMKKWEKAKTLCPFILRNVLYSVMLITIIFLSANKTDMLGGFMYANF